jgi:hypothetical protein
VPLPHPPHTLLRRRDTRIRKLRARDPIPLFRIRALVIPLREAGPHDEDVALLEGDALLLCGGDEVGVRDGVVGDRGVGDGVARGVRDVVD